jgi:hypothetical protein
MYAASGYDHRAEYQLAINEEKSTWSTLRVKGLVIDSVEVFSEPAQEDEPFGSIAKRWCLALISATDSLKDITGGVHEALVEIQSAIESYSNWFYSSHKTLELEPLEHEISVQNSYILDAYLQTLLPGRISPRERLTQHDIDNIWEQLTMSHPKTIFWPSFARH